MRFLVDMNLAVPVAAWLRGRGHDAVHLLEAGLADLPDSAVLAKAHAEGRVLPTCDLGFGELLADPGGPSGPKLSAYSPVAGSRDADRSVRFASRPRVEVQESAS